MRIAVFADIHSNFTAFEACVKRAESAGVERMIFLGDYVSDSARPQAVMDLIYDLKDAYPCTMVTGNREEYMVARRSGNADKWAKGWTRGSQSGSLLYTYEKLRGKDLDFFAALPATVCLALPGQTPLRLCHGTPGNTRDALMPGSPEADFWAGRVEEPYILCGHSHRYLDFVCRDKRILNFAAAGSPVEGDPRASMGILESGGGDWRFQRVEVFYDVEKEIAAFIPSGLNEKAGWWPAAIALQLRTGESYPLRLFQRVLELGREAGTPEVLPEALWDRASAELGIAPLEEENE